MALQIAVRQSQCRNIAPEPCCIDEYSPVQDAWVTFAGLMDCQRSVTTDRMRPSRLCRTSAGQLAGMCASRLAHSFCVLVGVLRHRSSSFTRDACDGARSASGFPDSMQDGSKPQA